MARRTVSLERSSYERLKAAKRPGESFSGTVNRLTGADYPSFSSLSGVLSGDGALRIREALRKMRDNEAVPDRVPRKRMGPVRGRRTRY